MSIGMDVTDDALLASGSLVLNCINDKHAARKKRKEDKVAIAVSALTTISIYQIFSYSVMHEAHTAFDKQVLELSALDMCRSSKLFCERNHCSFMAAWVDKVWPVQVCFITIALYRSMFE